MTEAAPTARPPKIRYTMNSTGALATPDPQALMMKSTAATINILRRPNLSASQPAQKAPTADPKSIDDTDSPVPTLVELKAFCNPSTVPFMTPLS